MPGLTGKIRAVGFDLDGTLVDSAPDLTDAINAMLTRLGLGLLTEARVRSLIGHGVEQLVVRCLGASLGREPHDSSYVAEALKNFRQLYAEHLFRRSRVYPGVVEALQLLVKAQLPLCCVTNKEGPLATALLKASGLWTYLAFTLFPSHGADRKPSPAMLRAACERLAVRPDEMLYVGDSLIDIRAARAAGCPIVAVNYGYEVGLNSGEAKADAVIASLTELFANPGR